MLKNTLKIAAVYSAALMVVFVIADIIIISMPMLRRTFAWLAQTFSLERTQHILGAMVLVLGTMAFLFKKNHQPAYGIVELSQV